jgi:hypothetical protein
MIRFLSILLFTVLAAGICCNASFGQAQSENNSRNSNTVIKPKRLSDLEGNLQSVKKEIWDEITREFNRCLPAQIGNYLPYEDKDAYIQSGTLASDPTTGLAFFKSYRNGESAQSSKVVISIIANSPMVSSLTLFLSNPMIAKDTGKHSSTYSGFKAIEEYDPVYRTGEINLLLSSNTLITISATNIPDGKLLSEFANSIDFKRILAVLD